MTITYSYDRIEEARSVNVYAGQDGGTARIAIAGDDGTVPDGNVKLRMAYAFYDPSLGFWVSGYDYFDVSVSGGDGTVTVLKDLSSEAHYENYFNMTAIYTSADGAVKEVSSKVIFSPA